VAEVRRPATERAGRTDDRAARRTRRRFVRRQWARRWGGLRHLLVGLLLVGLVAGGVWLVWFSSVLAVKDVTVHGTTLLRDKQVRRVAAVPEGDPLARVDLAAATSRVEALAAVKDADISREWPDTVRVDVVERTSVAVVDLGGRMRGMDADGVVFQEFSKVPGDLPRVEIGSGADSEALKEGARVVSALPDDLARRVAHVEIDTVDQIGLALRDGRQVVWGSAEESGLKAEVLAALLGQEARVYDVSVPSSPVTRAN
jgi:cell division protein FtsQ